MYSVELDPRLHHVQHEMVFLKDHGKVFLKDHGKVFLKDHGMAFLMDHATASLMGHELESESHSAVFCFLLKGVTGDQLRDRNLQ